MYLFEKLLVTLLWLQVWSTAAVSAYQLSGLIVEEASAIKVLVRGVKIDRGPHG